VHDARVRRRRIAIGVDGSDCEVTGYAGHHVGDVWVHLVSQDDALILYPNGKPGSGSGRYDEKGRADAPPGRRVADGDDLPACGRKSDRDDGVAGLGGVGGRHRRARVGRADVQLVSVGRVEPSIGGIRLYLDVRRHPNGCTITAADDQLCRRAAEAGPECGHGSERLPGDD
jgi:hypothetical protein